MERVGDRIRIRGDGIEIELAVPEFGECTEEPTQLDAPDPLPAEKTSDRPVWLALRGEREAASLRLSTRGALLVIDDGCVRAGDVTTDLLGQDAEPDDPVFSTANIAPEEAYDAGDLRLRRRSKTMARVMRDRQPLIDVTHFDGEALLTARALDQQRWLHLALSREYEYKRHDGVSGRVHTFMWTSEDHDATTLVFENDYRYGSDGSHRAETDVRSTRVHHHQGGVLETRGARTTIEGAFTKFPRDECPDVPDFLAFVRYDESVRWAFKASDSKKPRTLGTARLRATFASGCIDFAAKKLAGEKLRLTGGAPSRRVDWTPMDGRT